MKKIVKKTAHIGFSKPIKPSNQRPIKTPARQAPKSWKAIPLYLAVALIADLRRSCGDSFGCGARGIGR